MRTARALTLSHSMLAEGGGGVYLVPGVYLVLGGCVYLVPGGVLSPGGCVLSPRGVFSLGVSAPGGVSALGGYTQSRGTGGVLSPGGSAQGVSSAPGASAQRVSSALVGCLLWGVYLVPGGVLSLGGALSPWGALSPRGCT